MNIYCVFIKNEIYTVKDNDGKIVMRGSKSEYKIWRKKNPKAVVL